LLSIQCFSLFQFKPLSQTAHTKLSSHLKTSNLFAVDGLIAVVTGSGTGIGAMIAKGLAANGAAAVYVLGLRIGPLEEVAKA
jgi:hypothetical protein